MHSKDRRPRTRQIFASLYKSRSLRTFSKLSLTSGTSKCIIMMGIIVPGRVVLHHRRGPLDDRVGSAGRRVVKTGAASGMTPRTAIGVEHVFGLCRHCVGPGSARGATPSGTSVAAPS